MDGLLHPTVDVALALSVAGLAIKALRDVVRERKNGNCQSSSDALLKAFIHEYRVDRERLGLSIDKIEERLTVAIKDISSLQAIVRFLERREERGKPE